MVICYKRGGGAIDAVDTDGFSDKTGSTERRILWRILLEIRGLMALVDDDEPEVFYWGKQGRTWANDDRRGI